MDDGFVSVVPRISSHPADVCHYDRKAKEEHQESKERDYLDDQDAYGYHADSK